MRTRLRTQPGFTLVEMLIVIIVLGILAMIIIPQLSVSTEDAKVSTLKTNLSALRSAVEIYYAQHDSKYPGQTKSSDGTSNNDAAVAASSMVKQLTQYTDQNGKVSGTKDNTYKYGPYVKGGQLPKNPFLSGSDATGVESDATKSITATRSADGSPGWKFHFNTGVLYANDGNTFSDGTNMKDL